MHEEDLACHARFGRTKRNAPLYGPPGHAYVFLIYGMYDCFNVVCEPKDSPAAVLVRALEPVPPLEGGTDGPGKLCRALAINRAHNGADLVGGAVLWLERRDAQEGARGGHAAHRRRLRRRVGGAALALRRRRLAVAVEEAAS